MLIVKGKTFLIPALFLERWFLNRLKKETGILRLNRFKLNLYIWNYNYTVIEMFRVYRGQTLLCTLRHTLISAFTTFIYFQASWLALWSPSMYFKRWMICFHVYVAISLMIRPFPLTSASFLLTADRHCSWEWLSW